MTERTYKKDLDVINVVRSQRILHSRNCNEKKINSDNGVTNFFARQWFREEVSREAGLEGESVVSLIELLADVHGPCLQEMETRLERWESNARHNIGDFLYNTLLNVLPLYDQYVENLIPVLEKMEYYTRTSRRFDQLCRDFETQKHCYLPLTSFLLKPLQRLLHYNSIIDSMSAVSCKTTPVRRRMIYKRHNVFIVLGLLDHYPKDHTDFEDCLAARDRLGETLLEGLGIINRAVNIRDPSMLARCSLSNLLFVTFINAGESGSALRDAKGHQWFR